MGVPRSPRSATQEDYVRLSVRVPALGTVVIAGLTLPGRAQHERLLLDRDQPDGSKVFVTGDVNTPSPGTIPTLARSPTAAERTTQ